MFGFGHGPELIIILVIALIVLGPGKLPEVAGMLGKAVRELRKASADLQNTFDVNQLVNPPAPAEEAKPPEAPAVPAIPSETSTAEAPHEELVAAEKTAASEAPPGTAGPTRPRRRRTRQPTSAEASEPAASIAPVAAGASVGPRRGRTRRSADMEGSQPAGSAATVAAGDISSPPSKTLEPILAATDTVPEVLFPMADTSAEPAEPKIIGAASSRPKRTQNSGASRRRAKAVEPPAPVEAETSS